MSLAALIEDWHRLGNELNAAYEHLKVQKKRHGEMKKAIIKALHANGVSHVVMPSGEVVQVERAISGKAKTPTELATELSMLLKDLGMKDAGRRADGVDRIMKVVLEKRPEDKLIIKILPPQPATRFVNITDLNV